MSITPHVRGWMGSLKARRNQAALLSRRDRGKPARRFLNSLDSLEQRALLTVINWTGAAGTADWFTASNWDGGAVPGPADDVVIDLAGADVQIGSGSVSVHSLELSQSLTLGGSSFTVTDTASIQGGSLTVNSGVNTVNGPVSTSQNAWITVSNSGTEFQANQASTLESVTVKALAGALVAFPNVTSYTTSTYNTIIADGTPSTIDLHSLTTLSASDRIDFDASAGGHLDLSGLTSSSGLAAQAFINVDGAGSLVDLSKLTSWSGPDLANSTYISVSNGGTIQAPQLTSLSFVQLTFENAGTLNAPLTSFSHGEIIAFNDASVNLPGLTTLDTVSLTAGMGGFLTLPNLTSYSTTANATYNNFQAYNTAPDGRPSKIDLPQLATISGPGKLGILATGGGQIDLKALVSALGADLSIYAYDAASGIDFSSLKSLNQATITGRQSGSITFPSLTSLDAIGLYADTGGSLAFPALTSLTPSRNCVIQATGRGDWPTSTPSMIDLSSVKTIAASPGGLAVVTEMGAVIDLSGATVLDGPVNISARDIGSTVFFTNLISLTSANISSFNGASLDFPRLTTYTSQDNQILAQGNGALGIVSTINFPSLTSITGSTSVQAYDDGQINLNGLTGGFDSPMMFGATGSGSSINLSHLTSFASPAGTLSYLQTSEDGQINLSPQTVTLSRVNVQADGTISAGTLQLQADSSLTGRGTIVGNVDSAGPVKPGGDYQTGTLRIQGNYTQRATGTLNARLNGTTAGSQYDQLAVTGTATLDGTLAIFSINGYIPGAGDAFQVVTYTAHSGTFSQYTGLTMPNGTQLQTQAGNSGFSLFVQANYATFLKLDTTTQGSWKGTYGADGWNVSQDPSGNNPSYPAYATVSITDAAGYTWNPSTTNLRALQQTAVNSQERLAACWYNADTFSINVTINDGQVHQVALYALDWSSTVRSEAIQVIDNATGAVLDTRSLAGFHNGVYQVWEISGSVTFRVTNTNVADFTNAVLSGIFFGGPQSTPSTASYVTTDTATQGNWKGTYGADGFNISQDVSANNPTIPAYASVAIRSASNYNWAANTSNTRALEKVAPNSASRIAGTWYDSTGFSIDVSFNDGQTHQVALYALDWDSSSRSETIVVLDQDSGITLDTRSLANFHDGAYLVWNIKGNVTFKVTNTGPSNAVISGLFFGGSPSPTATAGFVAQNSTTQGTWKGTYGASGFDVSQDVSANNPGLPTGASVQIQNATNFTWTANTSDVRALQQTAVGTTNRIASAWYSNTSFNAAVSFSDNLTHQIALYALDWDHANRNELIQVIDTATGAVLDTRSIAGFQNGVYLVWNVKGNVTFKITNTSNTNAVISGLFFN